MFFRTALLIFMSFITPLLAQDAPKRTVHEACVEMIETAAGNVRKPASQDSRDALQDAYLATFAKCLKHGVESIERPAGFIATTMANFRKSTYRTYAFRNVRESFEELQLEADREFRSVTLNSDVINASEAVEMILDAEAATHLQPYISGNMSREQIIVQLAYISGMPVPSIAQKLGKNPESIYKIKRSGDHALKASFEAFEENWTVNTAKNYLPKVFIFALIAALIVGGLMALSAISGFLSDKFGRGYAKSYETEMHHHSSTNTTEWATKASNASEKKVTAAVQPKFK